MSVQALKCPNCGAGVQAGVSVCAYCESPLRIAPIGPAGGSPGGGSPGPAGVVGVRLVPSGRVDVRALVNAIGGVANLPPELLQNRLAAGQYFLPQVAASAVDALSQRLASLGVSVHVDDAGRGGPPGGGRGGPGPGGGMGPRGGPGAFGPGGGRGGPSGFGPSGGRAGPGRGGGPRGPR